MLIIEYSYNPCKPFSEGSNCENVVACRSKNSKMDLFKLSIWYLVTADGQSTYSIGFQDTAVWNPGSDAGDSPSINYVAKDQRTIVRLECSTTGQEEFEVFGEGPETLYLFRLTHKCACWNACTGKNSVLLFV